MNKPNLKIILAQPRGFCAGVERAIDIVNRALIIHGSPIYVRHEIVHNKYVVNDMKARGVIFIDDLSEVPPGSTTIFSAHGVSEAVEKDAQSKGIPVIDATCPLVKKVHIEAIKHENEGREIILIGHSGHPEVDGTRGRVQQPVVLVQTVADVATIKVKNPDLLAYVTQTTLSVDDTRAIIDALKLRFPSIVGPELRDICYATQNRQDAVRNLAKQVDMILVIGAQNSSNSNRLRDLSEELGTSSHLVNDESDVDISLFSQSIKTIGITAGASAPEILLERILDKLSSFFILTIEHQQGLQENVKFKLPQELQQGS